ncbi:MAG TPA: DNRLRE domain-containing protein [Actinobacteria bacterium]|nr:DNRLRE domain-containing protein [Actinomycetota bacterium]
MGAAALFQSQSSQTRHRRVPVEFNISTIPAGATIEAAQLRMYMRLTPPSQRIHSVHRVTQFWLEGNGDGQNNNSARDGVTWIERRYGDNNWTGSGPWDWAVQGDDFIGAATASTPTLSANGWMNWNVSGDVVDWNSAAAPNYGWLIKDDLEDTRRNQRGRYISREGGAARRPALDITFLLSTSGISTNTVEVGWYGQISVQITNTGGSGGDQINQANFVIPVGWSRISTSTADYTVAAPGGKTWNVITTPMGSIGPQTVAVAAASGADDLADTETITVIFNVEAPWVAGTNNFTFASIGAAGGTYIPAVRAVDIVGSGSFDFSPSGDTTLSLVTLTGLNTTATGFLGSVGVRDARGTGSGWNVTVSSTDFILLSDPTSIIPAGNISIPVAPQVIIIGGTSPPVAASGSLAGAGLTLLDAAPGNGAGHYEVTPDLELQVPAATLSGIYAATITETIFAL